MTQRVHVDFTGSLMPTFGILMAVGITGSVLAAVFGIIWSFRGSHGKATPMRMRVLAIVGGVTAVVATFASAAFSINLLSGEVTQTENAIAKQLDVTIVQGLPTGRFTPKPPYTITVSKNGSSFDCKVVYVTSGIEYNDLDVTCDTPNP